MADASLYNGQPTDTGLSCPSARLTSCTPSILNNKGGVSVENVPDANRQWFVLRVSYGRIIKAKDFVETKGLKYYPNFALSTSFSFLYQQFYNGDLRYCVLQILFILIFCMISSCILAVRKCRQLFAKIMLYSGFSVYYKCAFQKAIIDYQLLTC